MTDRDYNLTLLLPKFLFAQGVLPVDADRNDGEAEDGDSSVLTCEWNQPSPPSSQATKKKNRKMSNASKEEDSALKAISSAINHVVAARGNYDNKLPEQRDDCDDYGRYVANELRSLPNSTLEIWQKRE